MLNIAQAVEADIPLIQAAAAESWRVTYADVFTSAFIEDFLGSAYGTTALRRSITSERSLFLVAKEHDHIVGFCQIGEGDSRNAGGFQLFRIYVIPSHWRRGVGQNLLARAEAWALEQGGSGYCCYVHRLNEVGKGFYLKNGFLHVPEQDLEGEWYLWKNLAK